VWNNEGCWILANNIADMAGASLPFTTDFVGATGYSNHEWFVAYNGPAGQTGNWESLLKPGEMVTCAWPQGGGHIFTVVSGSGASAMTVDNSDFGFNETGTTGGQFNTPNVIIQPAHSAVAELQKAVPGSIVIYELDTPVVTDLVGTRMMAEHSSQNLSGLFSAASPSGLRPIIEYQIYETSPNDTLMVNGHAVSAYSAATAVTVTSLSQVTLLSGSVAGNDTVEVRAANTWWGDWQSETVSVVGVHHVPLHEYA
jgi:hypothetical protein